MIGFPALRTTPSIDPLRPGLFGEAGKTDATALSTPVLPGSANRIGVARGRVPRTGGIGASKSQETIIHTATRDRIGIGLLLLLAVAVLYGRTTGFEFLDFDDEKYLRQHHHVRNGFSIENLQWALTTSYFSNWHPVTWLSYFTDYALFGFDSAAFHATNVVFHALATLLLFAWLCQATGRTARSGVVAAVFALHPLHVESVAWISERKDVLSAFFGFAALLAYTSYARRGGIGRYCVVTLLLALGLMSKSMLVTLPCVFLLLDAWPLRRFDPGLGIAEDPRVAAPPRSVVHLAAEKLPWFAMSAVTSWATWRAQTSGGSTVSDDMVGLPHRLLNAVHSYAGYLGKLVWPTDLTIRNLHPNLAGGTPLSAVEVSVALAALGALTAAAWRWRATGYAPIGWLWYLGMLVPAIGLIQVGHQAMADRYTYLPLVGVVIAGVWGGADAARRLGLYAGRWSRAFPVSVVGLLFAMAVVSWEQVGVWRNDITLTRHGLSINRYDQVLHSALARELVLEERLDDAIVHYEIARRIAPAKADVHLDLAEVLALKGHYEVALREYTRAVELDPDHIKARKGLGALRLFMGDFDAGIDDLMRATESSPRDSKVRFSLASALILVGRPAEAIVHLEQASRMLPRWARPIDEMAWLFATHPDPDLRDGARALELARHALRLATGRKPLAMATLAAAHAELGDFTAAVSHAERALELAEAADQTGWAAEIRESLPDYRAGRPRRVERPRRPAKGDLSDPADGGLPGTSG